MPFSWVPGRRLSAALTGVALTSAAAVTVGTVSPASAAVSPGSFHNPVPVSKVIGRSSIPKTGRYAFLLQLAPDSTASVYASTQKSSSKAAARVAARQQLTNIQDVQARVVARLKDISGTTVLYETHAAMAAVAVSTDVKHVDDLAKIAGVTDVYPIAPKQRDLTYAVPFQGAPAAWEGDGSGQNLGQGVKIADIDTGLDYTHADFGGPGTIAAWKLAKAHQTSAPAAGTYDPNKFDAADSYDLVGNDYNGGDPEQLVPNDTPMPDPNPLDCGLGSDGDGHGTHTAGISAGYGVTADGKTFTGPWNSTTVSTSTGANFKVGPGMAPKATLISYRVFGCLGSTDVISAAIDRAIDPNGDGDTSDHVNVINLSLGGDFGSPTDGDTIEANLASKLGVTLAIAMGNAGDQYDVGSSPGVAQRAIAVAATADAQSLTDGAKISVDGGAPTTYAGSRSAAYDWSSGDLKGTVVISPADNPTGCSAYSAADAAAIKGKVVLVDWNEEQVNTHVGPAGCGSVARGGFLRKAGAVGFIFADNHDAMSQTITGDDVIPGILLAKTGGDAIRTAIAAGKTVTVQGTVAATFVQNVPEANDTLASYSSRGIRTADDSKPDVAAVGDTVFSALVGGGTDGQTMSGTSMATPMVAGEAALIAGKHPGWTPEQIKADIMNTADHDVHVIDSDVRYGPMRVGSGRIDAGLALKNDVLAAVSGQPGEVGVSFGPIDVTGATTLTKTVDVTNTGTADETYGVSFDEITKVTGVSVTASPSTVTVPAGGSSTVTVTLSLPSPETLAATKSWDPSRGAATNGSSIDPGSQLPQVTLAEESGNLLLTAQDTSVPTLRVPVYANPRPASQMTQAQTSLPLDQTDVPVDLTGTGFTGSTAGTTPVLEGFDLQATSPKLDQCASPGDQLCVTTAGDLAGDISTLGVTSDYPLYAAKGDASPADDAMLSFAIGTYGTQDTPAGSIEYDVYIDVDGDGQPDVGVYNTRLGTSDVLVAETVDLTKDPSDPDAIIDDEPLGDYLGADADGNVTYDLDLDPMDSDVIVLPVSLAALEQDGLLTKEHPVLHYGVITTNLGSGTELDAVGADPLFGDVTQGFAVDPTKPGIWASGQAVVDGAPALLADQPGTTVTVHRDADGFATENGLGAMLVHFNNTTGHRVQTLGLPITLTESQTSVEWGSQVGLTVKVPGASGSVDISDASTGKLLATGGLDDGVATIAYTPKIDPGAMQLQATYTGPDGTLTSLPVTLTVTKATPMVIVQPKPSTFVRGKSTKVVVSVFGQRGLDAPTGTVVVTSAGKRIASGDLGGDGTLTFTYASAKPQSIHLVANYSGDAHYVASKSYPARLVAAKATSKLHVSAPKVVHSGAMFTVKVRVPGVGKTAPTGLVVIHSGAQQLAHARLRAYKGDGIATLRVRANKVGTLKFAVVYAGDGLYQRGSVTKAVKVTQ